MEKLTITIEPKSGAPMSATVKAYYGDNSGAVVFAEQLGKTSSCNVSLPGLTSLEFILVAIPPSEALVKIDGPGTALDATIPAVFNKNTHFRFRIYR